MPIVTESEPFVIDPGTGNLPAYPEDTVLVDGRVVTVWQETLAGDVDVKARILNADGSASSSEFTLSSTTAGNQYWPIVAGLANGGFVAVWWDQNDQMIRSRAYDATGTAVGAEASVRSVAGNPEAEVIGLAGGNYVIGSNSGWQVFTSSGQAVTPLNTVPYGGELAALADGGFGVLITYPDIQLQTYSASGVAGSAITLIDLPDTPPDPSQPTTSYADFQVVQLDNGDVVAAYVSTVNIRHVPPTFSIGLTTAWASSEPPFSNNLVTFPNTSAPYLDFQLATDGDHVIIHYKDAQGDHLSMLRNGQVISLDAQIEDDVIWGVENDITALSDGSFLITSTYEGGIVQGQIVHLTDTDSVINGTLYDDILIGTSGFDTIFGRDGDDVIVGGGGADDLYGGAGHDTYFVSDTGTQVGEAVDKGYDTIHSSVDLTLPDNVEALFLTGGALNGAGNTLDNVLGGNGLDNSLQGLDGNDRLYGDAGNDSLYGGAGDDALHGQAGDDLLYGWTGADRIEGGTGGDTIYGEDGSDTLFGEDGNDTLYAGIGDDFVAGQAGTDALWGEAGNDFVYGGQGGDQLAGGAGADLLYYAAMSEGGDTIVDFNSAEGDRIVVDGAAFGAFSGFQLTAGVGFLSGAGATPTAATATFYYDTSTQNLWYDIDGTGSGQAVLIAHMANNPTLHASDFIFA